jgi:replicative DNA helicase
MTNQNRKFELIEGYEHIEHAVTRANDKIEAIRSGKLKPLVTSSLKEQDKIGGLFPSDQYVVAARTGAGKTTKLISDLCDYADEQLNPHYKDKLIILYDSWEMPDWRNVLRMYSKYSDLTVKELINHREQLADENLQRIRIIADQLKGFPIYFSNYSTNITKWKYNKSTIAKKFPNHQIVNACDHTRLVTKDTEKTEENLISNLMLGGVHVKNQLGHINIWLSQMNRNIESGIDREEIGNRLPVSSDIFGSDAVYQCADVVNILHRPGMYGLEEYNGIPTGFSSQNPDASDSLMLECILKQRDGWTGVLYMEHDLARNKIFDKTVEII